MFKPAKVVHAKLIIPKLKSHDLIVALHEAGVCQLEECNEKELKALDGIDSAEVEETKQRLAKLLQELDEFKPILQPENLVKSLLFPKPPEKVKVDLLSDKEIVKNVREHLEVIEPKIGKQLQELRSNEDKVEAIEAGIEELEILPDINTRLFSSTKNIAIVIGLITKNASLELQTKLKNRIALIKEKDENTNLAIIACRQTEREELEKELHAIGFEPIKIVAQNKTPRQMIKEMQADKNSLLARDREIKLYLRNMSRGHWEKLGILSEELEISIERINALKQFKTGKSFSVMEAWIPEKDFTKFEKIVSNTTGKYFMETDEREDAPTLLNNPGPLKPFEMLTELYSVPKTNGLDPTPVIAITFAIFFGYMLTDFMYGILLTIIAFLLFRGIGKYNPELRKFASVLIALGISTTILGAAFTSYFGDFFPRIGIPMPGLLDPLKEVVVIIGLAVVIGVLHISLGLLMGFVDNFSRGKVRSAFADQGIWLIFLIGAGLAMAGGIFAMIGLGLIILSVVLNIVFKLQEGGAVIGILSVFDFSGFIGDIFSYARLTALAIGTAGIALAVNFMALLVNDMVPVVGIVLAAIVFIVGHLFNLVMNGLGAFIHSLRLHFLEFFQKFYEGGGTLYKPFYAKREKTEGGE